MTLNPMYAKMGLTTAQGVGSFLQAGFQAKLESKLQKYRNRMLAITTAMSNRNITLNEISTRDASRRLSFDLSKRAAVDQGAAEVSAAAAGVQGNSIDATMRGLRRSALDAQAARKARTSAEMAAHLSERRNVNVSAAMQLDIKVTQRPSLLAAGMGLGKNLVADFNAEQPEGDKLGDRLGRFFKS